MLTYRIDEKTQLKTVEKKVHLTNGLLTVQVYKSLQGHGVAKLLDYAIEESYVKLTLEYIEGKTLAQFATSDEWLIWMPHVLKNAFIAIDQIHQKGYLHRDIKPENIVVDPLYQVHFIDLDQAIPIDKIETFPSLTGTLKYMAPEVLFSPEHIGKKSDYFSLASCFYHTMSENIQGVSVKILEALSEMMAFDQGERPDEIATWALKVG